MNRRLRTILQYLFFFALGFFFVWLSIKDIGRPERQHIRDALRNARYYLVAPVFIILFLSHYVRALRWRLLIESLGHKPSKTNTFFAVMIGYLANQAVLRLGEVLKCTVLSRYEKVPADKLVGTIILERLIDALTLVVVFAITLAIQPGLYGELINSIFNNPAEKTEKKIPSYVILLIVAGLIALIIGIWMIVKKKKLSDVIAAFKKIGRRVWEGISAVKHLRKRGEFIILTVLMWSLYLAGGYIGFFALKETEQYGIREAFTVLSAGSIGMTITPGGIGGYAFFLERAMNQLYDLESGVAMTFGWLLWLAQTTVILIGGLISFAVLPWYNKKKLQQSAL